MAPDVVDFRPLEKTRIIVVFSDGCERRIDLATLVRAEGVFSKLQDPSFVASGKVNPDTGTIEWPTGADLSPDVLYQAGELVRASRPSAA